MSHEDCKSMYPSVHRSQCFPVGHSEITTEDFQPIQKYFGIMNARVLAPQFLKIPLLTIRIGGKIFFLLCRTCAESLAQGYCNHDEKERALEGTFTTMEILCAEELEYQILEILEVWNYPLSSNVLFK